MMIILNADDHDDADDDDNQTNNNHDVYSKSYNVDDDHVKC